jgi:hypothetical protein
MKLKKNSNLRLKNRKNKKKRYAKIARRRFARQCARAAEVRDGSMGPASKVRHIDPVGYIPAVRESGVSRPKSLEMIAAENRKRLEREATKLTGMKPATARQQIFGELISGYGAKR